MRSTLLTATLIAAVTLGGAAFAGTSSTTAATATSTVVAPATTTKAPVVAAKATPSDMSGTIKSINTKLLYVVIGGWKYHLPKGFDLTGFKVGEKVTVTFTMSGKKHEVSTMKAAV